MVSNASMRIFPLSVLTLSITLSITSFVHAHPGLLAVYDDGTQTVHRIVPTPNFTLSENESVHSQIAPKFEAVYSGLLKISRGGEYIISGDAQIEVDGQNVSGKVLQLSAGDHPLMIKYSRRSVQARLQLRWKSDFFREEPIPPTALSHVKVEDELGNKWLQIEQGRELFENQSCGACHGASGWGLSVREGPDLSNIGSRVTEEWLSVWLKNPKHYRKTAAMPTLLASDEEIRDTVAFLSKLVNSPSNPAQSIADPKRIESGKDLFNRIGCVKCHTDSGHSLASIGSKYQSVNALASFIVDPLHIDPSGRMPQMFDPKTQANEALKVAEYLYHTNKSDENWSKIPGEGDIEKGRQLVASRGCISCHSVEQSGQLLTSDLASPLFVSQTNDRLLRHWSFDENVQDNVTGNNAQVTGNTNYTAGSDKLADGKAFNFDKNTYLEITHFPRPNTMSITAWIKTSQGGEVLSWAKEQSGTREFRIGQDGQNSLAYGEYNIDGGWKLAQGGSDSLIDDRWHHIAVVRDGTQVQLYLDGKAFGRRSTVQKAGGNYTEHLLIGALSFGGNPSRRFSGAIDDLAIWGEALSIKEIARLAEGAATKELAKGEERKIVSFDSTKGCLSTTVAANRTPNYQLSKADRESLQAFMNSTVTQPIVADAPVETFHRRVRQFSCTACHSLNDQNTGLAIELTEKGLIRKIERPPTLTDVGGKLQISWIENVLLNKKRTRPWMNMRMPHFGSELEQLPSLFPAASGSSLVDESETPSIDIAKKGQQIIGVQRGKVACINCHSYRGINRQAEGVVPAPDMSEIGQTLRRDWFDHWLHNPSRMSPGTSMPQFFQELPLEEREEKIIQLWAAFVHQADLPLPNGLIETRTEGTRIVAGDVPVLFRASTMLPTKKRIDRAINVALPGGTNFTFDAATAKLEYAWKGPFIDAGPAWNGRGGNPVNAGNDTLYVAPSSFPFRIESPSSEPMVRFLGYYLVKKYPVFRYLVDGVEIHERIDVTDQELIRHFTINDLAKPIHFITDDKREYTSPSGTFRQGVLTIPPGKMIKFEVHLKHR